MKKRVIRTGEIVAVKGGHIFNRKTLNKIESKIGPSYIQIENSLFIGPRRKSEIRGCMIYSNHSCNPNIGLAGSTTFVAMRNIGAGEEITHDWAMTDNERYQMKCNCGAENCRGVIAGKDWQKKLAEEVQRIFLCLPCKENKQSKMKLTILSLKGVQFEGEAAGFNVKTTSGEITVLDHHRPLISVLAKSEAKIIKTDGSREKISVNSGFLEMGGDNNLSALID